MSRRLHVHIGPRKTGTTYLQGCLVAQQRQLSTLGWTYPLGALAGERGLNHEAYLLRIIGPTPGDSARILRRSLARSRGQAVLSGEALAALDADDAARLVAQLDTDDVHVVITARALHRVLPSLWQQDVRNGRALTQEEFAGQILAPEGARTDSSMRATEEFTEAFWRAYALGALVERWTAIAGRVTVVTVPAATSTPAVTWSRFLTALGLDPGQQASLGPPPEVARHESLSTPEAEVLREVNRHLRRAGMAREDRRAWSIRLVRDVLTARPDRGLPLSVPAHLWDALVERTAVDLKSLPDALSDPRVTLVGDIDDLHVPASPPAASDPADLSEQIARLGGQCITYLQRSGR